MNPLTIIYITSRLRPQFDWFYESLLAQGGKDVEVIFVDTFAERSATQQRFMFVEGYNIKHVPPKPTVWQGKHRITKQDYWAAANARNTGICLCRTEWIAFVDDRSVLMPGWLDAIREAMAGNYAVCGAYEKRHNMKVENGIIADTGQYDGTDPRSPGGRDHRESLSLLVPIKAPGSWWFGCTNALPLEWALKVNGYEEGCDSLSLEDCIFGMMLENNGLPIMYDARMKVVQDRTPSELGTPMRRTSKERHPKDKSDKGYAALRRFGQCKQTMVTPDLRGLRQHILNGGEWPIPAEPQLDWFDGQRIETM